MSRRRAKALVRHHGGFPTESIDVRCDLVVLGAEGVDGQNSSFGQPLPDDLQGQVVVIDESELWQKLGLVDDEIDLSRLYTPSMLAELLQVPIASIRRWHRRGLIHPVRQIQKLPYFDFQEVASARMIARLVKSGATPDSIERQLVEFTSTGHDGTGKTDSVESAETQGARTQRPLSQLSIIVEGKNVLLRDGEGLVATNGQKHFNFLEASDGDDGATIILPTSDQLESDGSQNTPLVSVAAGTEDVLDDVSGGQFLSFEEEVAELQRRSVENLSPDELIELAIGAEDDGDEATAIEFYRALSMSHGPTAHCCFRIAELLYQCGDLEAARERYFMAIEIDEAFVEARASLGCVLMELGQSEFAIATFRGALDHHPDFPDVHYHLARLLDESGKTDAATTHWEAFLQLAPKSPWAEEARDRLE